MKRLSAALVAVLLASLLTVVTASAASASCDYSSADQNNGWGWNAETGSSCAPQQAPEAPQNDCDYSAAPQNNGWGWNPVTGTSCAPAQSAQQPAAQPDTTDLVQPRLLRGIRQETVIALSWDAAAADSFVVVRNGTPITEIAGSEFTDVGLVAGVTYKYTVYGRRGVTVMPTGQRPPPVLPPSWPTVELEPGTSGDVAGAPTTSSEEIYASLQAINDALYGWALGIVNPLPGSRVVPPIVGQLLTALLGANPVASQEAHATETINAFLSASGSNMRVPNPLSRPGDSISISEQYGLATGLRNDIFSDIGDFQDFHGRSPDHVETLAIVHSAIRSYVRQGLNVSSTGYDPGSPDSIAQDYVGIGEDGTLGEFGGTDSEANAAAEAAAEADAQEAADTYAGGDRDGEFGSSSSGSSGNSGSGGFDNTQDSNNNGGDSAGGQSTGEAAADTYSGGDPAGEFG